MILRLHKTRVNVSLHWDDPGSIPAIGWLYVYIFINVTIIKFISSGFSAGSKSGEGIPWLHKIPILGAAFGKGIKSGIRTELVVIITPRALYDDSQLREVSKDMRTRVRSMKLIEK